MEENQKQHLLLSLSKHKPFQALEEFLAPLRTNSRESQNQDAFF